MDNSLYKTLKMCLKFFPVLAALMMMADVVLIVIGYSFNPFVESVAGFSLIGVILLLLESFVLKFCNLYRAFVIYDGIVYNCILFEKYCGFGEWLSEAHGFVMIGGAVLLIFLLFKFKDFCCE